jgi:hypothetical protein
MSSRPRPRRAVALLLTTLGLATLLGAAPVAAGSDGRPPNLTATGRFGVLALIDNPTWTPATCIYEPGTNPDLKRIRVRKPIVFARDRRAGRVDSQTVGWRFFLEHSDDLATWTRSYRSPIQTRTATDVTNADFRGMAHSFTSVHPYYRVKVRAFWYRNGDVEGTSTVYPTYYTIDLFLSFVSWYCEDPLV